MDLEAPADAWYVWFGVVLVTVAFAGVALSFPSEPAPDATEAANTVDEVAANSFNASATYDHDADEVLLGFQQIAMRNSGGTDRATIAFGTMTPVREHENLTEVERGRDVLLGADPAEVFDNSSDLATWRDEIRETMAENDGPTWRQANGELRVKRVRWGDVSVIFVDA